MVENYASTKYHILVEYLKIWKCYFMIKIGQKQYVPLIFILYIHIFTMHLFACIHRRETDSEYVNSNYLYIIELWVIFIVSFDFSKFSAMTIWDFYDKRWKIAFLTRYFNKCYKSGGSTERKS